PAGPFRGLVNHDPRVRERQAPARARRLEHDRPHRIRHSLHDDRDLDSEADDVADGIVNGQDVGDVAAGAVDVEGDRPPAVARELAHALDTRARRVLLDVSDEIDVTQPRAGLLPEHLTDSVDELGDRAL